MLRLITSLAGAKSLLLGGVVLVSIGCGLGWTLNEWRNSGLIASAKVELLEQRVQVAQDVALANERYIVETQRLSNSLSRLQAAQQKTQATNSLLSNELLQRLSKNDEESTSLICAADSAYLDGLRNLKQPDQPPS